MKGEGLALLWCGMKEEGLALLWHGHGMKWEGLALLRMWRGIAAGIAIICQLLYFHSNRVQSWVLLQWWYKVMSLPLSAGNQTFNVCDLNLCRIATLPTVVHLCYFHYVP